MLIRIIDYDGEQDMNEKSGEQQAIESIKFCISGTDRDAIREAHFRAMSLMPEEVSGIDHYENSFIIDSNINSLSNDILSPFLRWCENLGDIKVEKISPK
jgi:hypothetical protein